MTTVMEEEKASLQKTTALLWMGRGYILLQYFDQDNVIPHVWSHREKMVCHWYP